MIHFNQFIVKQYSMKGINNPFKENLNFGNIKLIRKFKCFPQNHHKEGELSANLSMILKDNSIIIFVKIIKQICFKIRNRISLNNCYNKDPKHEESLHSINKDSILLDYDSDKNIPMHGFEGIQQYLQQFNKHSFPLQSEAYNLDDIRKIYEQAIKNIQLDGTTCFNPIIRQAMRWAEQDKNQSGNGKYMDEGQTLMSIVDVARQPLSLIVVGIENSSDLQAMDKLDGNDG